MREIVRHDSDLRRNAAAPLKLAGNTNTMRQEISVRWQSAATSSKPELAQENPQAHPLSCGY